MKKLIVPVLSLSMLAMSPVLVFSASPNSILLSVDIQKKTKIKKEDLPEIARHKLDSDEFKGWIVVNVYKLEGGGYEVELKKGDTTQVLDFDKEGNLKKE